MVKIKRYADGRTHTFFDVPPKELVYRTLKLYLMGALVWDYTETVLDQVSQMRLESTKKTARAVRALRRDYDQIRAQDLDADYMALEWNMAEQFEQIVSANLTQLHYGILNETRRRFKLDDRTELLVESVQTAMTMLEALKLYADQCDEFIRQYYPEAPHSILNDHYSILMKKLPDFVGEYYIADSPTRTLTARIFVNELNQIKMHGNPK